MIAVVMGVSGAGKCFSEILAKLAAKTSRK